MLRPQHGCNIGQINCTISLRGQCCPHRKEVTAGRRGNLANEETYKYLGLSQSTLFYLHPHLTPSSPSNKQIILTIFNVLTRKEYLVRRALEVSGCLDTNC